MHSMTCFAFALAMNTGAAPDVHRSPAATRPAAAAAVAASTRPASRPAGPVDKALILARNKRLADISRRFGGIGQEMAKENQKIANSRRLMQNPNWQGPEVREAQKRIESLKAERDSLQAEKREILAGTWSPPAEVPDTQIKIPDIDPRFFEVGQWGYLVNPGIGAGSRHEFGILQIVGPKDCLIKCGETPFWVSGISTEGLIDNGRIQCILPMKVAGTKRYTTAIGASKTVFLLRTASSPAD